MSDPISYDAIRDSIHRYAYTELSAKLCEVAIGPHPNPRPDTREVVIQVSITLPIERVSIPDAERVNLLTGERW